MVCNFRSLACIPSITGEPVPLLVRAAPGELRSRILENYLSPMSGACTHASKTVPRMGDRCVKTLSVVFDQDFHFVAALPGDEAQPLGAGVPHGVGDGFEYDALDRKNRRRANRNLNASIDCPRLYRRPDKRLIGRCLVKILLLRCLFERYVGPNRFSSTQSGRFARARAGRDRQPCCKRVFARQAGMFCAWL